MGSLCDYIADCTHGYYTCWQSDEYTVYLADSEPDQPAGKSMQHELQNFVHTFKLWKTKSEVWDPTIISLICGLLSARFILISDLYSKFLFCNHGRNICHGGDRTIWWFFIHHQIAKLKSSPIFTNTELAKSLHKHMNTYHSKAHSMRCCRGQVLVILGPGHSQCVLASVLLAPSSTVIDDRIHISSDLGGCMPLQPLLSLSQPCASNLCWFKGSTHRNWELS